MIYDVIIAGAGASGLTAALALIRKQPQLNILVIEKEKQPGRKLSASGNGKCNLANKHFDASHFFSQDRALLESFINRHTTFEIISFFEETGIMLYDKDGYYYPVSNQAKQVTELLYHHCHTKGVHFLFDTEVTSVTGTEQNNKTKRHYIVKAITDQTKMRKGTEKKGIPETEKLSKTYKADYVILCTGSMAAPKLGGSPLGYRLAKRLNLQQEKVVPVLTPAYVEDEHLHTAKGVRTAACISLYREGALVKKEYGQLQINEDNLSGIAVMNLSCLFSFFSAEERKDCLHVDILPDVPWAQLKSYVTGQCQKVPELTANWLLEGLFPAKLGEYILRRLGFDEQQQIGTFSEKQINRLVSLIKKMTFTPVDHTDYDRAQAAAGGVAMKEIDDRFECHRYPGLYITGELLDVNGECGGYNLSFAVLSGLQAADSILKKKAGK